jgi:hypothetical protein
VRFPVAVAVQERDHLLQPAKCAVVVPMLMLMVVAVLVVMVMIVRVAMVVFMVSLRPMVVCHLDLLAVQVLIDIGAKRAS